MSDQLKIYCKNIGKYVNIKGGETLQQIAEGIGSELTLRPICALVNNQNQNLGFQVFNPKMVEFLDESSPAGRRVYTRSLCMILYAALRELMPESRLCIEHSVSKGYFCRLLGRERNPDPVISTDLISRIKARMQELVDADMTFIRKERLTKDVIQRFREQNLPDKVLLLETIHDLYTVYYKLGDTADSYYGPLAPSTGYIRIFDLLPYKEGMLLLGPDDKDSSRLSVPEKQEKLHQALVDYQRFNQVIRIGDVGELNLAMQHKRIAELINAAEAMHDKMLGRISDRISEINRQGGARIVLIAGPSSSGKTTSTKRLAIQLMTNLIEPKMISLDDYFVDRDRTPRDETGDYDYEHIHALDLERLNSDLSNLLAGKEVNLPTYSFELGRRIDKEKRLRLDKDDVLLIEGIHGLNPELVSGISEDMTFKLYVSALTTLSIDDHNWISTTDNRLLRRIVRDHKYRHTPAIETIRRWPSVRRGEQKWIFPFQENADATFNSSLIFELGVMKDYAEPLLRAVPHDAPEYAEAYRLLKLLHYFEPIPANQVPTTSLLREFLGGSSFHY